MELLDAEVEVEDDGIGEVLAEKLAHTASAVLLQARKVSGHTVQVPMHSELALVAEYLPAAQTVHTREVAAALTLP